MRNRRRVVAACAACLAACVVFYFVLCFDCLESIKTNGHNEPTVASSAEQFDAATAPSGRKTTPRADEILGSGPQLGVELPSGAVRVLIGASRGSPGGGA